MAETLVTLAEFRAAQQRIAGTAARTPLVPLQAPGVHGQTWLKNEGAQPIGSFKLRGAYNKIAGLTAAERGRGVLTYSSGNHAQGVAYAARAMGARGVIVMPRTAPAVKIEATRALGAEIIFVETASSAERKARAEQLEQEHGYVMIPPYDDRAIIAGQGTCGLEILEEIPDVDLVLVPVSGGGLLSGVAAAIRHQRPEVRVVGVEPALAADAQESLATGRLAIWPAELTTRTLADGLRTQSLGLLNFEHIRAFVDAIVTVTEEEIRAALRTIYEQTGLIAEPSGAVAAAALLFHQPAMLPYRKAVAVVSGSNIEPELLREILGQS
ncbi:MAG TPA: threonine/serine dehydratase [Acidobacteriaceae bacterium]